MIMEKFNQNPEKPKQQEVDHLQKRFEGTLVGGGEGQGRIEFFERERIENSEMETLLIRKLKKYLCSEEFIAKVIEDFRAQGVSLDSLDWDIMNDAESLSEII